MTSGRASAHDGPIDLKKETDMLNIKRGTRRTALLLVAITAGACALIVPPAAAGEWGFPGDSFSHKAFPYKNDGGDCTGHAQPIGRAAIPGDARVNTPRVMAWNVSSLRMADGTSTLGAVAHHIALAQPDIVFLNEVRCYYGGDRQDLRIAAMTEYLGWSFGYATWEDTTTMGFNSRKGVAILSRYPIVSTSMHMMTTDGPDGRFGTLGAVIRIAGMDHRVFSTRFSHTNDKEHGYIIDDQFRQMTQLMQSIPAGVPVIFGGDFNSGPGAQSHDQFRSAAGMRNVLIEKPDANQCPPQQCDWIDHIYLRGPYSVSATEYRWPGYHTSDHPYVLAALSPEGQQAIPVPSVVGKRATDATTELSASFAVNRTSIVDETCNDLGKVLDQSPLAGTFLVPGSKVTIFVATKPSAPAVCP